MGRRSTATGTKLSLTSCSSFSPRRNPARVPQLDPQVHPSGWPSPTQSRIGLPSAAAFCRACHRLVSHGMSSKPPGLGLIRAWSFGNVASDRLSLTSALARTFASGSAFSCGLAPARDCVETPPAPAASITASTAAMDFRLVVIMALLLLRDSLRWRDHDLPQVPTAEGGSRTHTLLRGPDFESGASADSATSAPYFSRVFC